MTLLKLGLVVVDTEDFLKKKEGDIRGRVISKDVGFSVSKLPLRTVISCWHTLERFRNLGQ